MDTKFVLVNNYFYKPYSFLFLYLYTRENILKEVEFTLTTQTMNSTGLRDCSRIKTFKNKNYTCAYLMDRETRNYQQFTHSSSLIQSGYQFLSICASKAKVMNKCIGTILDVTPCLDLARDCTSSLHSATGQTGLLKIVLIAD